MHILDEPRDCYTKRNVRGKQIAYDISYKWDLKKWYKGAYLQNWNTLDRHRKQNYGYQWKVGCLEGDRLGIQDQ